MTPGRCADEFAAALIERAQAGEEVQMLIDDFGTDSLSDEYWQQLRDASVEVRFFRQFDWRSPLKYNSRTHRKLLIIDRQQVLIGDAGVSDDRDGDPDIDDSAPWLEFEVSYEGQVASLLEGNFFQNWAYTGGELNLEPGTILAKPNEGEPLFVTNDTSTLSESTIRLLFQIGFYYRLG
ncbi:phospholipase D-like domain-containing protein [Gloeocapsa sp. PCC 7428]|uniref:phospholipase D-like domain-containing protein n=1 Tax=Gloeocapsa sp. PCC 7428 TaxID=1173026 RepID=UPI0002F1B40B|nr:phospholipase D-like domain-containing protein [Gloeocapsa sp. PCC 7428]